MTGRSSRFRVTGSPVLVGAVTVLLVVVAVFLAYNANQGLPFVPTTELTFESPSAAALTEGNEVLEGGARIGFVGSLQPVQRPDGRVVAEIGVVLDAEAGPIPSDSTVAIRPRSLTGLKYVELTRGTSSVTLQEGDTIAVDQARVPVQIDDVQAMYDEPTREGMRRVLRGAGEALAGRGIALNESIAELPRLLRHLEPVARSLARRATRLPRLIESLERTMRALAPVSDAYARGFTAGADALEAWSRSPDALSRAQQEGVLTLETGVPSLRVVRPFLENTERFSVALRGAAEVMPGTLPEIEAALRRGIPVQRQVPSLTAEIEPTLTSLEELTTDPDTTAALRGLTDTVRTLRPITRFVGPYVTVCNLFNYAMSNTADAGGEPALGVAQRTLVNLPGTLAPTGITVLGATEPADGLHLNLAPAAVDRRGNADCESGQRGYIERKAQFAPRNRRIVIDPATPGNQGPTYTGRPRVPEGQTFSRRPELGPDFPRWADR